jgi:hypothetical protein
MTRSDLAIAHEIGRNSLRFPNRVLSSIATYSPVSNHLRCNSAQFEADNLTYMVRIPIQVVLSCRQICMRGMDLIENFLMQHVGPTIATAFPPICFIILDPIAIQKYA